MAAVRDIVNLIAIDPLIAMVSKLINSFHRVSTCRQKKNEDLSVFVSRFRGLAAEHLMHSNASTSSQIGEVLAITLLNNANLEERTLTNAKLQLISLAEARAVEMSPPTTRSFSTKDLKEFKSVLESAEELQGPLYFRTDDEKGLKKALAKYPSRARGTGKEIQDAF